MRMSKMKSRGKKIVAVALSLAMMVPVLLSQTVVSKAITETESNYLQLKSSATTPVSLEKNDEFTLDLQTKKEFQNTMGIEGKFIYKENGKADQYFEIIKVDTVAAGWASYYDNDTGKFGIIRSNTNLYSSGAAGSNIASITFRVKKAVDEADITLKLSTFEVIERTINGGITTNTQVKENATDTDCYVVTCAKIQNQNKTRTVTFSNDKDIIAKVATLGGTNKEFKVPIDLTVNSGFNAIKLKFSYPGNSMNYTGYEIPAKMRAYLPSVTERTEANGSNTDIYISMVGNDDMKLTGQFIVLKFVPVTNVTLGQPTSLTLEVKEIFNTSSKKPKATFTNPTTNINFVQGSSKGDVCIDVDGVINLLDVTYALQYYNGVRRLTDEQIENADVNNDGKVNLVDVLMILKKVNGENVNF